MSPSENEDIIENANKWYKFWLKLPFILFIVDLIFYFIWGIVDSVVLKYVEGYITYYGSMGFTDGFVSWFVWQIIGFASGVLVYFFTKILISPIILKVGYLKKISDDNEEQLKILSKILQEKNDK